MSFKIRIKKNKGSCQTDVFIATDFHDVLCPLCWHSVFCNDTSGMEKTKITKQKKKQRATERMELNVRGARKYANAAQECQR